MNASAEIREQLLASLQSGYLFGRADEPLDDYGKRLVRVIAQALSESTPPDVKRIASYIAVKLPQSVKLNSSDRSELCDILVRLINEAESTPEEGTKPDGKRCAICGWPLVTWEKQEVVTTAAQPPASVAEDWKSLPVGAWFFEESPSCTRRYSVQERTSGGCSIVCSTPYIHPLARRQMIEIAEAHNRDAAQPAGKVTPEMVEAAMRGVRFLDDVMVKADARFIAESLNKQMEGATK